MIRLEQIRVDPDAPSFAGPHPKGEYIWSKQYPRKWQEANLADYPTVGEEVDKWNEGAIEARHLAERAGMFTDQISGGSDDGGGDDLGDDGNVIAENRWFYQPFPCYTV